MKKKSKEAIAQIEKSKLALRKKLMRLSFKEKIACIIQMQKISSKLNSGRRKVYVWNP